jgi:hypothetical protein
MKSSFDIAISALDKNCFDEKGIAAIKICESSDDLLAALEYWFDSKADPKTLARMARAAISKARGES